MESFFSHVKWKGFSCHADPLINLYGMKISSSRGFKNPQKLALGKKNLASRRPTALGRTRSWANF
jgi:hypothetical protein